MLRTSPECVCGLEHPPPDEGECASGTCMCGVTEFDAAPVTVRVVSDDSSVN